MSIYWFFQEGGSFSFFVKCCFLLSFLSGGCHSIYTHKKERASGRCHRA